MTDSIASLPRASRGGALWLFVLLILVIVLGLCSLNVGASRMNLINVLTADR